MQMTPIHFATAYPSPIEPSHQAGAIRIVATLSRLELCPMTTGWRWSEIPRAIRVNLISSRKTHGVGWRLACQP